MMKLKLQYFDHLMQRADSLEKTVMLGKIEGRKRREWERMRCWDGITDSTGHESEQTLSVLFAQSCPTPHDPVDCSRPGFPVYHQHSELAQTHVHWVRDDIQPSHPLSSPSPPAPSPSRASESFPVSQLFASGGQSIGGSASTSVLLMNTQDWFPSGWTGWTSLQSKGLSRVFSNPTVQKYQFFGAQLSL